MCLCVCVCARARVCVCVCACTEEGVGVADGAVRHEPPHGPLPAARSESLHAPPSDRVAPRARRLRGHAGAAGIGGRGDRVRCRQDLQQGMSVCWGAGVSGAGGSCLRRRNLMSPPTDSHGPTLDMTSTCRLAR